jgi:hypothetical protein
MDSTRPPPKRQTPSPALNAVHRQLLVAGMLYSLAESQATRDALDRLRDAQLLCIIALAREIVGVQ